MPRVRRACPYRSTEVQALRELSDYEIRGLRGAPKSSSVMSAAFQPYAATCRVHRERRLWIQPFELQPEQPPQVGDALFGIGLRRCDPPAQRGRVDEENVARNKSRVFLR